MNHAKSFKDLLAYFQRKQNRDFESGEQGLLKRPSRVDVIQAFRLILGREPEEKGIASHLNVPTVAELRRLLLTSEEFRGKYRAMYPEAHSHPNLNRSRRAIAFIHLLKTGGTTLREILGRQFTSERRCPILEDKLHVLSLAELSQYDFFAGHFDISCRTLIPRDNLQIVALFREPSARLISLYRFLRAHPATDEFAHDHLIQMAHQMSAENFFLRPELRDHFTINNHYLFAFGRSFSWFAQNRSSLNPEILQHVLHDAKFEIRALAALGITERFDESVNLICHALGFVAPTATGPMHVTDNFQYQDARFNHVDPVSMTPQLARAMHDLIQYDQQIYEFAVSEFAGRLQIHAADLPKPCHES